MVIPPQTLSNGIVERIEDYTSKMARALNIHGPFNVQYLVKDSNVYVIECNLRASRSAPYTSKATGIPLIWIGAKVMMGRTLRELGVLKKPKNVHVAVKVPTFSFMRLRGADPVLGVEMTSTGEVACLDYSFAGAYIKALMASNLVIPSTEKPILLTVREQDHPEAVDLAMKLRKMGYQIFATSGTAEALQKGGILDITMVRKVHETSEAPDILEILQERKVGLVINIPNTIGQESLDDEYIIRRTAVEFFTPVITRMETAKALVESLMKEGYNSAPRTFTLESLLAGSPLGKYV
jgi:carbamoyl-phosphate synthase large subunit